MKCITERTFKPPLQHLQTKLGITNKGLAYLSIYPSDVIDQALTSALRAGTLSNPYSYIQRACAKIAASMSYTITQDNLVELRKHYDIPEGLPFYDVNFAQQKQRQLEQDINYRPDHDREQEGQALIEKLTTMEPTQAAFHFFHAKRLGFLNLLVDEWPPDLQAIIDRLGSN